MYKDMSLTAGQNRGCLADRVWEAWAAHQTLSLMGNKYPYLDIYRDIHNI